MSSSTAQALQVMIMTFTLGVFLRVMSLMEMTAATGNQMKGGSNVSAHLDSSATSANLQRQKQ